MTKDSGRDIEIIPPQRTIATREEALKPTAPLKEPGGVVRGTLTGLGAALRARVFRTFAEETRAKADYVDARGELANSYVKTARAVNQLHELPEILDHDKQMRKLEREEELIRRQGSLISAKRTTEYADIGYQATKEMRQHTIDLVKARKEQKIVDAIGSLPQDPEEGRPAVGGEDAVLSLLEKQIDEMRSDGADPTDLYTQLAARKEWLAKQKK